MIPLAGMSATDAAIQKKIYGSSTKALIISNEEMEDIIKIVKSLQKGITETIRNETEEQENRFLPMILGTLAASLSRSSLTGTGVITVDQNFYCHLILWLILKYNKNIIKMSLNLMVFSQEIIYLKYRIGHV